MYDTNIQTTLAIRGHRVHITYRVTKNWAVDWWLTDIPNRQGHVELLETLLRTHEYQTITEELLNEFESRQYHEEASAAALFDQQDIPF